MWHFGKGQPLRLGCPSIFITSPLVIWKLASPIFVSRVAGRSSSPRCVLISSFFSRSSLSSHTFLLSFFPVVSPLPSRFDKHSFSFLFFFVNTVEIITVGNKKHDFPGAQHKRTKARRVVVGVVVVVGGVQGLHVNTSCEARGDREKG